MAQAEARKSKGRAEKMFVLIPEPFQLRALRVLMERLYSENRMDGDAMRNGAQTIEAVLRSGFDLDEQNGRLKKGEV